MNNVVDAVRFEHMLKSNGIPPRPAILETISRELEKDIPDFRLLERAVLSDVAIAGGIIKTVNSPFFGLQRRVRTALEALEVMGLRMTAQIVACIALKNLFPDRRLLRFWDASVKIAEISSWLVNVNKWPGIKAEDAYTFGLFRDCGVAVLMQRVPHYGEVLRQANEDATRPFTEVEEVMIPVSHAHVGAMMTQSWWLPLDLTEAIRYHHDVEAISPVGSHRSVPLRSAFLIAVSQVAERLLQQATGLCHTREWDKLGAACLERLELDEEQMAGLLDESRAIIVLE